MAHPRIDVGMYVTAKPPLPMIEQLASAAQEMGCDSLFVWDHIQDFIAQSVWDEDFSWLSGLASSPHEWFDYQTLLGYLAAKTPNLRLGVGVTESVRRHPILIAQAMATLAHVSPRPPILGIGFGERLNTEPYGMKMSHMVSRLEEALQIIRLAFKSRGPFDFQGNHFQLSNAVLDLQAPAGRTPEIWIAAHGPQMLQLTGKYGDGWYPFASAGPDDYAAKLEIIRSAAREAGRDPNAITPAFHPLVVVAPTEAEARAMLSTKAIRYWGLIFPAAVWQLFGVENPFGENFRGYVDLLPETYDRETMERAIAAVPPLMIELAFIWGTPEQVVSKLRAYGEAGLRHVVPVITSAAVSREAADFSVEAMAYISRELMNGQAAPDQELLTSSQV
jgi:phthiodiolone/phenolphthiodiolone dimycocerosates ketoreductase